ncbi:hypothetical protein CRI94_07245 [Longibacter salinarum]|uniref:Uncharacterized protein n=1 Tax=Longibacter salinarum TaxID=1850348 RepID=A0A2A8CYZ6_9BACT|nr:hypothetical protein [Longibacter salinarum]PEN13850.1 hypothetical protein CRI94_07245 [Longibacter salinarum]
MAFLSFDSTTSLTTRIVQGILSILGVYAVIRFLPRIISFVFKRFVVGIIGEIVLVTVGALLTQQFARSSSDPSDEGEHSSMHTGRVDA